MTRKYLPLFALLFSLLGSAQYYPEKNQWEERDPKTLKLDGSKLQEAVDFALNDEYSGEKDLRLAILKGFSREPYHELQGPTKERGGPAGIVLKNGYIVSKWGIIRVRPYMILIIQTQISSSWI